MPFEHHPDTLVEFDMHIDHLERTVKSLNKKIEVLTRAAWALSHGETNCEHVTGEMCLDCDRRMRAKAWLQEKTREPAHKRYVILEINKRIQKKKRAKKECSI